MAQFEKAKMIKNTLSWLGAAAIAAVVVGGAFLSGCGAAPEDGQEIGQATEELGAPTAHTTLLVGSDQQGNQCLTTGSFAQVCRWVRPYQRALVAHQPARFSVDQFGVSPNLTQAFSALSSSVLPALNGQLSNSEVGYTTIIDVNANANSMFIGEAGHLGKAPVGDTFVTHYLFLAFNSCQSADQTEFPGHPGTFRSCQVFHCDIDTDTLKANFPASAFAGNLRQVAAACVLIGMGSGLQSVTTALNFRTLSAAAQALTFPLDSAQAGQLRRAGASQSSDASDTFYNCPCSGPGCIP